MAIVGTGVVICNSILKGIDWGSAQVTITSGGRVGAVGDGSSGGSGGSSRQGGNKDGLKGVMLLIYKY